MGRQADQHADREAREHIGEAAVDVRVLIMMISSRVGVVGPPGLSTPSTSH